MTRRRSGQGQGHGGVLCTDRASASAAAAAAASAAASKRNALLQASKHCLLLHGAASDAAASARTIGAMVLIFAATTPYSSRLNLALVVAVELRLRCWRGGCGDTKTTGCQVGLAGENLEQELLSDFFISFVVLLGRGRRGQRKNEGADSSLSLIHI